MSTLVDCELRSYGGDRARCRFVQPADVDELVRCIRANQSAGRRLTFRGGGYSLDSQSLNDDLVIGLSQLQETSLSTSERVAAVGAGVLVGELARTAFGKGLFPPVLITTQEATVAGIVASNGVSRFTPVRGHVGEHVLELEVVTATGERLVCSPEHHSEVFHGIIGGLGYLGCIVRVRMKLDECKDQVETRVLLAGNIDEVLAVCVPPFADPASRYALLMPTLDRGIAYACRYVTGQRLHRYTFVHQPRSMLRLVGEFLMRTDWFNGLTWWLAYRTHASRYVDPLFDHAFFMDGNVRMRHLGWKLGFQMLVRQQSFQLPVAATGTFLRLAKREFTERGFWPSLGDALYSPTSQGLLSASFGLDGFLITLGFEIAHQSRAAKVAELLERLSAECRKLGGRVVLGKSVHASAEDVAQMYAHAVPAFSKLKRELDPKGLLANAFLDRVFPSLA